MDVRGFGNQLFKCSSTCFIVQFLIIPLSFFCFLCSGGAPLGTAPVDANGHPTTEGADEVNGDVHVCGKCRGEFIVISEFLEHKQNCFKDRQVLIADPHNTDSNTEINEDNQNHSDIEQAETTQVEEGVERREGELIDEEHELKSLVNGEDTKDHIEEGTKQTLPFDVPKSEGEESQEPMDFTVNHPLARPITKSESERPSIASIANGLTSLPLPPSNLALSNMEHTKFAVSQICHSLAPGLSPPTQEDMAIIQEQLYTLQQQHLQQLQLIQHIQHQVNTYTAQNPKLEPRTEPRIESRLERIDSHMDRIEAQTDRTDRIDPPKSSSPTPSSTSSSPTLPTVSPPSASQAPPPPHLLSPPTSTTPVLPPSFESPLPPGHPGHRPGPPPSILRPGVFPLPPHRPPFELLQQAAIPPVSSPLHSVPPSPFGGPGGLLGLQRKGKPPNVSIFDAKFTADDPFFRHKCRFCHKVFGSDSALQIHIRSHTGERPFKCNICGNRFSTKGNLKVHFQRHQARYPHIQMDCNPHPPSPPPQERPSPLGPSPIHPPSIHQVPMPTIPNDVAKLPMETTNQSHQAVQPSSGSPNMNTNRDELPLKASNKEWHPPTSSSSDDGFLPERPPRPSSEPPRSASEPIRSPMEPRPNPDENRPASSSDFITPSRSSLSPGASRESPSSPPVPTSHPQFLPPSSSESLYGGWGSPFNSTPSSLKLLAEQGFRPSETSKLQELVENIEQKITDPNQCVICHRVLSCKSALQMHYRVHTGERPFRCKICSRSFTTKGNLKTHYGVHRLQPPMRMYHDCPICQKRFTNEIVLHQHLRLHAAEGIPIPNSMNFMRRPEMHGQYGPEIALQRPTPMMMNGGPPHLYDREKLDRERESLSNGPRSLTNGPSSLPNGERSDDLQSGERKERNENEMEQRKREAEMDDTFESDEGLTEKQIEEAMFTPSEGSQGDAASPSVSYHRR